MSARDRDSVPTRYQRVFQTFKKYKTTVLLIIAAIISAAITGLVLILNGSSTFLFTVSMVALVPNSSLLRHCVRHLVAWIQTNIEDLHRAHLVAGVIDCLFGYVP